MGFRIASNIGAMTAHTNATYINKQLNNSLEKLSSGYKINKAADDASGLAIADSLRTQALSLDQAIRNANDAIGIIQIADKAMDEQVKILDTIKVKAVQAAQDGQTSRTRAALQADITRLMEELDNIAATTTFNGKSLLAGAFSNAKFQIGAYSNTTINASIGATSSDKIGQTRFETGKNIERSSEVTLRFKAVNGRDDITLESVPISHSVGTGLGTLAEVINKNSNDLQVRASWRVESTGSHVVGHTIEVNNGAPLNNKVEGLVINDVKLGTINDIFVNDSDGKVVAAINNLTDQTGVRASIDPRGRLVLNSIDGRGIRVSADAGLDVLGLALNDVETQPKSHANYGRLTLIRNDARDILVKQIGDDGMTEEDAKAIKFGQGNYAPAEAVINLRSIRGAYNSNEASAIGAHSNQYTLLYDQTKPVSSNGQTVTGFLPTGVTTFRGAQSVMDIADTAIKSLDKIRSDLGSVQIQLEATVNNISVTRTNIKFSESGIRDTDFASESTNFKRNNILAQAGSYALSQANTVQQGVLKLLQ